MCKMGNKDKFTEQQLNLTAAILLCKNLNWAGLLLHQLKTFVMSVVQEGSLKRKFGRIINYYLHAVCPDMHVPCSECITHTANKDLDKTTLRFLEKVTINSSTLSIAPPTVAQNEPTAPHSNPRQPKSKHKHFDLRHQLHISEYIDVPKEREICNEGQTEFEIEQMMKKAAAQEEDRHRKKMERINNLTIATVIEDSDEEE